MLSRLAHPTDFLVLALVQRADFQVPEAQSNPRNLCSMGTTVVAQMPTDV